MTNQGRESRDRLMAAGVVTILERFAHCALRTTLYLTCDDAFSNFSVREPDTPLLGDQRDL